MKRIFETVFFIGIIFLIINTEALAQVLPRKYLVGVSDIVSLDDRNIFFLDVKFHPNYGISVKVDENIDDFINNFSSITKKIFLYDSLLYKPGAEYRYVDFSMFHSKVVYDSQSENFAMFFQSYSAGSNGSIGLAISQDAEDWRVIKSDALDQSQNMHLSTPVIVIGKDKRVLIAENNFSPAFFECGMGFRLPNCTWNQVEAYIDSDKTSMPFKQYVQQKQGVGKGADWRCGSVIKTQGTNFFYYVISYGDYSKFFVTQSADLIHWSTPIDITFFENKMRSMPIVSKYGEKFILFYQEVSSDGWSGGYALSDDLLNWKDAGELEYKMLFEKNS